MNLPDSAFQLYFHSLKFWKALPLIDGLHNDVIKNLIMQIEINLLQILTRPIRP